MIVYANIDVRQAILLQNASPAQKTGSIQVEMVKLG
jgi:hypothetical protein